MTAPLAVVDKPEGLLSIADAADWLAVGQTTVKQLLRNGDLPCIRVASRRRIDVDDLRAYVDRQRAAVTPTRRRRTT